MTAPIFITLWLLSGLAGAAIWFYFHDVFKDDESMSVCTVAIHCALGPISVYCVLFVIVADKVVEYFTNGYQGCGKTIFRKKIK